MTPKLCLASEIVLRDGQTNAVSFVNLIEEINPPGFPVVLPKVTFFAFLGFEEGDPQDLDGAIKVTLGSVEINRYPATISFRGANATRVVVAFHGFLVTGPGVLRLSLMVGDTELAFYEMIVKAPAPEVQVEPV